MENVMIGMIVLVIVGGAVFYIVKQKKKGVKCIGCPNGATCSGGCTSCSESNDFEKIQEKK